LEPILKNTYGVVVYQEQVMQLVRALAGFTATESEHVRKAMGKKKKDILDKYKNKFSTGAQQLKTMSVQTANTLWEELEKFSSYCFNKSHAAAYSYTAFQEAYLKVHYPAEYMAAQMSVEGKDSKFDTISDYERATRQMDVEVLPLDINLSRANYYVMDHNGAKTIRRGFKGIKGIGENAYRDLEKGQKYKDMFDFCSRAGAATGSDVVNVLIDAGAMDCFLPALSKKLGRKAERKKDLPSYYEENMKAAHSDKRTAEKEKRGSFAATFSAEDSSDGLGG